MATASQVDAVARLVRESVAHVDAIAPDALRAVIPALREARDELQRDLQAWLANAPNGANRFTAMEKTRALRAIDGALERVKGLAPALANGLEIGRDATGPLSITNLEHEIRRLGSIFGTSITVPQIDTAALIAKGDRLLWKRHAKSATRYAGAVGDDIKNLFAVGLAKGETFDQLVTRLRRISGGRGLGTVGDPAGDIASGLFTRHKHWADRIVRTEVMGAYNIQHDLGITAVNEMRPEGEEEYLRRWDSSPDGARCPLCAELHGKVAKIGKEFPGGIMNPPRHPHCRCLVLAWLKRWGDMKGETQPTGEVPDTPKKERPAPPPPLPIAIPSPTTAPPTAEPTAIEFVPKKNPKRVAAAEKAGAVSAERRREIHSAVKSNLSDELQAAWDQEGHKFIREEGARVRGVKDRVNAASKLSEAFAEKYGGGEASVFGNEGDRFHKRAEIEAKHADKWADDQESKYYEQARREMERSGEIDEGGGLTRRGRARAKAPIAPPKQPDVEVSLQRLPDAPF